ncbi:FtsQ-type POTRA domain-containing protein [Candidatus Pelagibacter sp.]|nr:FtsQ-type POTRA domain-containing protein [Candidatus Pelagibacter sp.]
MLQKTDKKKFIFFYLIIFLILSSIHNSNFKYNNFFIVKKIEVLGLDKTDNLLLEKKLKYLIGSNIFTINKESFELIKSENLINRYNVKKIYPNQIKVYLESAVAISVIKYLNDLFILGNNGKIIDLKSLPLNVPEVNGTNDIKKVYQTIKIINKSNYNIRNIKKIIFFPSDRIDVVLENKKKIRFPINLTVDNLNLSLQLVEDEALNASKIIDLRIPSKVITYE